MTSIGEITKLDSENVGTRFEGKPDAEPNTRIPKRRPALGELGNTIHAYNQTKVDVKKPIVDMKPPKAEFVKKTLTKVISEPILPVRKGKDGDNLSKINAKPILKREESLVDRKIRLSCPSKHLDIEDPDEANKNEPLMVTEYINDVFAHLRSMEVEFPIQENYLVNHSTTKSMRAILLNWLVEVHCNFKFYLETLHLNVAIVDRYLQENHDVGRDTLQLVGTSAMLVACKYEEMYVPNLQDFTYVCDDTFNVQQILKMEIDILKKLNFSLGRPSGLHFLRRYSKIAKVRMEHHNLAKYVLELALMDYESCHLKPSLQAAAACCLSMGVINEVLDPSKLWTPTLAHHTTYKYTDLKPLLGKFANLIIKAENSKFQAIRHKYSSASLGKISLSPKLRGPLIMKLVKPVPLQK